MSSITRISGSLLRITAPSFVGINYMRLVPIHSIMYINVVDRCLDIHYKYKSTFDAVVFPTNEERDAAISVVKDCFAASKESVHPVVKDYPF